MWGTLRRVVYAMPFCFMLTGGASAGELIIGEGGDIDPLARSRDAARSYVDPGWKPGTVIVAPGQPDSGAATTAGRGNDVNLLRNGDRARDYASPAAAQQGGGVIIIAPDPLAPASPGNRSNERDLQRNTDRARDYANPGSAGMGGTTVVIVPGGSNAEAGITDTQRNNAASLRRSRARAKGVNGTQTIVIAPGTEGGHGQIDNSTRVQMNTDKARGYLSEGGNHPGCSSAQVIIGRIEGEGTSGRVSSVVTGSDAVVSGVECR